MVAINEEAGSCFLWRKATLATSCIYAGALTLRSEGRNVDRFTNDSLGVVLAAVMAAKSFSVSLEIATTYEVSGLACLHDRVLTSVPSE